jgi:hypothetical protein
LFSVRGDETEKGLKWKKAKQAAFLVAAGLAKKEDLGKNVEFDWQNAVQNQIVIEVQKQQDSEFVDVTFANIFAVDDPKVAAIPKDKALLKLIGKEHAAPGAAVTNGAKSTTKPATNTAAKSGPAPTPPATGNAPATTTAESWNL